MLEILLAARGHRVSTDRLADLLWGEQLPKNAAGSLQTFVSVLRRHLASDREWAREASLPELATVLLPLPRESVEATGDLSATFRDLSGEMARHEMGEVNEALGGCI